MSPTPSSATKIRMLVGNGVAAGDRDPLRDQAAERLEREGASISTRPTSLARLLIAKTIQSIRVVGNIGAGILTNPTSGVGQNDVLLYGLSFARAVTQAAELVGELNGRASTRTEAFPEPRAAAS